MSNTTITTTSDGERVLTIPIREYKNKTVLGDRLYASISVATNTPSSDCHSLSVEIDDKGEVNLHFQCVYLSMSESDWDRVVDCVKQARAAKSVSA